MAVGAQKKKCPACGGEFECFSDNDCWCEQVQINRKEYAILLDKYNDCLCPACLQRYASE